MFVIYILEKRKKNKPKEGVSEGADMIQQQSNRTSLTRPLYATQALDAIVISSRQDCGTVV
jgi:hypothetical protein